MGWVHANFAKVVRTGKPASLYQQASRLLYKR